ncbi:MAG: DUF2298 domain-containing protein, partial [Halioglobus sp.]|nr:DUF2298 domain-containing protein [Halioglobus sp.]
RRQWAKAGGDSQAWIYTLILVGALLIIGPEFLYLRDQFGLRMNTIFKFYYAAWMLWSFAAAALLFKVWRKAELENSAFFLPALR